ncbi:MAG: prepilin-type N-terminal cleavage/methylation domain-containing protein [Acidisphaera sp.]|nr:prepilin-type N-terminal cleavage/methylation domain-containing protein [Acidisphaera sp.]
MRQRQAGFTLLEILVALVVLGVLVLGLTQGVQFGLKAWATQSRTTARRDDLDAVDRALRRLITHMDPGGETESPHVTGTSGSFAFTSDLPAAASALETRRVDVALGVERGRLVMRWTPHLHVVRFTPAVPTEAELLRGVDHLEISYLRAPGKGAGWQSAWTWDDLPELVRIRLVFAKGDPRHWPEIVAAPMRVRPED